MAGEKMSELTIVKIVDSIVGYTPTGDEIFLIKKGDEVSLKFSDETGSKIYDLASFNEELLKNYVISRGAGLVTNGSGFLKDNTNFSGFQFDSLNLKSGYGSFKTEQLNAVKFADEAIPVNDNASYKFEFYAKSIVKNGSNNAYATVVCLDRDNLEIQPHNLPFLTLTLLEDVNTQSDKIKFFSDLPDNDLKVLLQPKLQSVANLYLSNETFVASSGFNYPIGEYVRKFVVNPVAGNKIQVDFENRTLSGFDFTKLNKTLIKGSKIFLSQSGGSYIYPIAEMRNSSVPTDWTFYSATFSAKETLRKFTSVVKIGWLLNRNSSSGATTALNMINFKEV